MISPAEFTATAGHTESTEVFDRFIELNREKCKTASNKKEKKKHFLKNIVVLLFSRIIFLILACFLNKKMIHRKTCRVSG